ncbi:MAG: MerR family transcriptional regulator [Eubacteriales bacterium]|nr:MerR family transcriptional regulator [Eubacteriales bacterium]
MAGLCGVSVRTVQFYDTKGLLKPTALSEGGRRLYSQDDLRVLRLICLLKTLGLSLDSIGEILHGPDAEQVLLLLLSEQERQTSLEIEEKRRQLNAIAEVRDAVRYSRVIPAYSLKDMAEMMEAKKKLRKTHGTMLVIGIAMDLLQAAFLVLWIWKGIWWLFAAGMPMVFALGVWMTALYYRRTVYLCPACGAQFRPGLRQFLFAAHTPRTRKLTCTQCGKTSYCVETAAEAQTK